MRALSSLALWLACCAQYGAGVFTGAVHRRSEVRGGLRRRAGLRASAGLRESAAAPSSGGASKELQDLRRRELAAEKTLSALTLHPLSATPASGSLGTSGWGEGGALGDEPEGESGPELAHDATGGALDGASPVAVALAYDASGNAIRIEETPEMQLVRAELERIASQRRAVQELVRALTSHAVTFRDALDLNDADEIASLRTEMRNLRSASAERSTQDSAKEADLEARLDTLLKENDAVRAELGEEREREASDRDAFGREKGEEDEHLRKVEDADASREARLSAKIKRLSGQAQDCDAARQGDEEIVRRRSGLDPVQAGL